MRITAVKTLLLGHPKTQPPMQRSYALVKVETDGGLAGYGEASSNYGHSYPTVVRAIVDDVLARNLIGRDPADIPGRRTEMHVLLDGYLGWDGISTQVIGAIEIALWDIAGKVAGLPICRLLGAAPRPLPVYATGTTMFDATPEWYARYFDPAVAHGFKGVKVRLGTDPDAAIARVRAVRHHVGPRLPVMIDAYWGYSPDDALDLAHRLADLDIAFFEEPSPQFDLDGLRRLSERSPIPIAVGERVYTPRHFQLIADHQAAGVFEPDACISGGILACLEIAGIARASRLRLVPHLGSPTAIGLAANLHWAAAAGCDLVEYDIYPDLPARDGIIRDAVFGLDRIRDGLLQMPSGPGLGIDIDEDAIGRLPYVPGGTYAEAFPEHEARETRARP